MAPVAPYAINRTTARRESAVKSRNPVCLRNTNDQRPTPSCDLWVKARCPWPDGKSWLNKDRTQRHDPRPHTHLYQARVCSVCARPRIQRLRLRNSNAKSPSTEISFPAKQSEEHSLHRSHVRIEAKERSEILVVNIRMVRVHTNALLFPCSVWLAVASFLTVNRGAGVTRNVNWWGRS